MPWFEPSSSGALSLITLYAWGRMRHSRGTAPASWLPRWTAVWCRCAVYRSPAAPHTRPALWCRCKCSAGHRSDAAWCHGWYCRPSTYTHTHTHTHTETNHCSASGSVQCVRQDILMQYTVKQCEESDMQRVEKTKCVQTGIMEEDRKTKQNS